MNNEKDLDWTGERLVTQVTNLHGTVEHLHRYAFAMDFCSDMVVLDIASGEGYGTNLLATKAKVVFGVDISPEAIAHAKQKYTNPKLSFEVGSTSKIPLVDNSIDIVVSFETIEHHDEHEQMILEIKRVLKPDGILIISSPEKSVYAERDPNNPFHIKELTLMELEVLVKKYFEYFKPYTQRYVTGSIISSNDQNEVGKFQVYDGNFEAIEYNLRLEDFYNVPYFNFFVCTNSNRIESGFQSTAASFFNGYIVYKSELEQLTKSFDLAIENTHKLYKNSYRFKVGNFFLKPVYALKKLFKN